MSFPFRSDDKDDDKPKKESSEFKYIFIVIISILFALFALSVVMNLSSSNRSEVNTNTTLTELNHSAQRTLYVVEENSNGTNQKVNEVINLSKVNTKDIANNTKNINSLYNYIKNLVDTEQPKEDAFKKNVTYLITNVSKIVDKLDQRLKANNTQKIIEGNEYSKANHELLKQIKKIVISNGGVIINSNIGMNGSNSTG